MSPLGRYQTFPLIISSHNRAGQGKVAGPHRIVMVIGGERACAECNAVRCGQIMHAKCQWSNRSELKSTEASEVQEMYQSATQEGSTSMRQEVLKSNREGRDHSKGVSTVNS